MPSPVTKFIVPAQTYTPADNATLKLDAGATVKVSVDPGVPHAVVNVFDFSGHAPVIIKSITAAPYETTFVVPAVGAKRVIGVECRANHAAIVPTQRFTVVGSVPTPLVGGGPGLEPKLTGAMAVGLVDAAKVPFDVLKPHIAPWCKSIRVWISSNKFSNYQRDNDVKNGMTFEQNGVSVIWCVAQSGGTPAMAANAPGYMVTLIKDLILVYDADPKTTGRPIRIEWGNEPDLKKDGVGVYWAGTLTQYVASLAAVYATVKAQFGQRVQIIAAGFSYDVAAMKIVGQALANASDALAFHGYPPELSAGRMKPYVDFVSLAKSFNKPAIVTEGSPGYGKALAAGTRSMSDWVSDWPKYLIELERIGVNEVQIFNGFDINTTNSKGAMFKMNGAGVTPTACFGAVRAVVA